MSVPAENKELYNTILESLERQYKPAVLITRAQYRDIMQLSTPSDTRTYNEKEHPKTIRIRGSERILLADLAEFLCMRPSGRELNRPFPGSREN